MVLKTPTCASARTYEVENYKFGKFDCKGKTEIAESDYSDGAHLRSNLIVTNSFFWVDK